MYHPYRHGRTLACCPYIGNTNHPVLVHWCNWCSWCMANGRMGTTPDSKKSQSQVNLGKAEKLSITRWSIVPKDTGLLENCNLV